MELFVPIEHKNQAHFITPPLNFSLHLKEKSSPDLIDSNHLIDQQNQQNQQNQSNQLNHQNQPTQQSSKSLSYQKLGFETQLNLQNNNLDEHNLKNGQTDDQLDGYDPYKKIKNENNTFEHKRIANASLSPLSFAPSISNLSLPQSNDQNAFNINDIRLKMTNLNEINQNDQISSNNFLNAKYYQFNQLNNFGLNHQLGLNDSNNSHNLNNLNNCLNQLNSLKSPVNHTQFQLKRGSGRKPLNSKEDRLTPEEEEKRKQRRMRNKEAAARCRKRRVEHTNKLEQETQGLESTKRALQEQAKKLDETNKQLAKILEFHNCKMRMQN